MVDERHPVAQHLGLDHVVQDVIGAGDRIGECVEQVAGRQILIQIGECGDGHCAGHLTRRMAAHAVGDCQQPRACVGRILVPLTEETDV